MKDVSRLAFLLASCACGLLPAAEITGARTVPAWLTQDQENLKGEVVALPNRSEIDVPVNEMLIVELYSK